MLPTVFSWYAGRANYEDLPKAMTKHRKETVIGIAGALSGRQTAHRGLFQSAQQRLETLGIRTILEDDLAMPDTAVAAARRLLDANVTAVIGHFNSACAEAVIPMYRERNIPLLLPASSKTELAVGNGVFRLCSTDAFQAKLIAVTAAPLVPAGAAIEIAIDRTPYSLRLLQELRQLGYARSAHLVDIASPPASATKVRVVLATNTHLRQAYSCLLDSDWSGTAIFSDEAHIDEFLGYPGAPGIALHVVGPRPGYAALTEAACDWIAAWRDSHHACLGSWLTDSGLFDASAQYVRAGWSLYSPTSCFDYSAGANDDPLRYRFTARHVA